MRFSQVEVDYQGENFQVAVGHRKRGGQTLFLFHGLGCSMHSFRDMWNHASLDDYSIFAMDYPGFGGSDKPEGFSYEMQDQANIYARVAAEYLGGSNHIVAHSMGGGISLLTPPEFLLKIKSYANLEGNLDSADGGVVSRRTISMSYPEFVRELLPEYKDMADEIGQGRFYLDEALPLGFYKSAESLVKWCDSGKLMERFRALDCAKIYIYGDKNIEVVALPRLEGIQTMPIADSGHFVVNDNPDDFCAKLKAFLSSI